MDVTFADRELRIDGDSFVQDYRVLDAFELHGIVIVLFDPDAFGQPWQAQSRNLVAVGPDGLRVWDAEAPAATGSYFAISSRDPLTALFWSYTVALNWRTGEIDQSVFTK